MNNNKEKLEIPSIPALKEELMREKVKRAILNMAGILIVAAALTALMATRIFVLVQINGSSMKPTLNEDEVIILRQTKAVEKGDIVGFYYGGKILLKRVMAGAGDEVDIDREGNVSVNGERLGVPEGEDAGEMRPGIPLRGAGGNNICVGRQSGNLHGQPDKVYRLRGKRPDCRKGSIQDVADGPHGNNALGR